MSRFRSVYALKAGIAWLAALMGVVSPAQAPSVWTSSGIGGGGALFAPTFSPFVKNELSLFCDMGEQFRTKDLGVTWTVTPFTKLVSSGTTNHIQYGGSDQILYAITFANGIQTPVMSRDGGSNWGPIPNDPTAGDAYTFVVNRLNPKQMLISSWNTLYSSRDGGKSWFIADFDNSGSGLLFSGAAFSGSQVIACDQHGLLVSPNGAMFNPAPISGIPPTEGIVQFAYGQSAAGGLRIVAITNPIGSIYEGMGGGANINFTNAYTLKWGQTSWVNVTGGIPSGSLPFFAGMAQNDPNTIYLAGGSTAGMETVIKSNDGGQTWKPVLLTSGNANVITGWSGWQGDKGGWYWGGYALGFGVSPATSSELAITDYGFCHVSTDGGASWRQVYESPSTQNPAGASTPRGKAYATNGLENTACYCMAWLDANHVWAGYGDIGATRSTNAGKTWSFNYSGLNFNSTYQFLVATTGAIYAANSSIHEMYESTNLTDLAIDDGVGTVTVSLDSGQSWQQVGDLAYPVVGLSFDPNDSKRMYVSVVNSQVGGIYRCDDVTAGAAAKWTPLTAPPRTQGHAN